MRLIFIRHGDPDYSIDNLTEKGKKEVELLTERICKWFPDKADLNKVHFYTSPLGRAKATGAPALEKLQQTATELSWLQEFHYRTEYPKNFFVEELRGCSTMCWDLIPEVYTADKNYFNKNKWQFTRLMKKGNIKHHYKEVCEGFDKLLAEYGYVRNKKDFYDVLNPVHNPNFEPKYSALNKGGIGGSGKEKYQLVSEKNLSEECTLVFFCHLGIMFTIIAHLIGVSPMQLWQGFYVAPTSLTILNSEERIKGQAWFRVERLGDTNHLINGGEPTSSSGYFTDIFREV